MDMLTPIKSAVTQIIPLIMKVVMEWKARNTEEYLRKEVNELLEKRKKEVILKLLGFDNGWGDGFRLDHCNGRAGNSPAGNYLASAQAKAIQEWLSTAELPEITIRMQKDMHEHYLRVYRKECSRQIELAATDKASRDIQNILNALTNTDSLQDYLNTIQLIDPSFKKEQEYYVKKVN